nr:protein PML isoform X2 [Oryctolagus cuniculus]
MQQDPAPAGSPGSQRDAGPTRTPTMASPELRSEGAPRSPSPAEQAEEEDFQFLQCQGCHTQAKCPKLLPCLHTLCSGCLEAPGLHCPICQGPRALDGAPVLDNIFFESLQRRLAVHQQVVDMQAACTRCKEPADFWCFECEQLLCSRCFEAHQWFLKHEARPLAELRSQSVLEFLESTRKSNNIFCSNPNHRSPMLTSIYCRGCHKPLCCSCALLDSGHSDLKCDLSAEVLQRQDELDATARALRERGGAFGAALAQVRAAIGQLGRARADAEDLIRERVRQVVAHVQAQERELLQQVHACYQRDYEELAARLSRLEAVLQRMRTGGALVRRMKHYASDQEVLDMHGFLHEALCRLRQEEPQGPQAAVRAEGFDEFKVRLQDLVARVTQATDAILSRRTSPQSASTPGDLLHVDLPEQAQKMQAPPMAVVQSVPGAHPVPLYVFSIRDTSSAEEDSGTLVGRKRKSCYTQCPQKMIKLESEEKERPAQSSPEQPRPSTSKAVSPPQLDGTPSPGSPNVGEEVDPANSNHVAGDDPEEAEERVVVISSSEDSDDTEIAGLEPPGTSTPHPLPALATHHPPVGAPPCSAALQEAEPPRPPAASLRGISFLSRLRLPLGPGIGLHVSPSRIHPLERRFIRPPPPALPGTPACPPEPRSLLSAWKGLSVRTPVCTRPGDPTAAPSPGSSRSAKGFRKWSAHFPWLLREKPAPWGSVPASCQNSPDSSPHSGGLPTSRSPRKSPQLRSHLPTTPQQPGP